MTSFSKVSVSGVDILKKKKLSFPFDVIRTEVSFFTMQIWFHSKSFQLKKKTSLIQQTKVKNCTEMFDMDIMWKEKKKSNFKKAIKDIAKHLTQIKFKIY